MLSGWELWACANKVITDHDVRAGDFATGRIADLTRSGDTRGVATWQAIADRIDRLCDRDPAGKISH